MTGILERAVSLLTSKETPKRTPGRSALHAPPIDRYQSGNELREYEYQFADGHIGPLFFDGRVWGLPIIGQIRQGSDPFVQHVPREGERWRGFELPAPPPPEVREPEW